MARFLQSLFLKIGESKVGGVRRTINQCLGSTAISYRPYRSTSNISSSSSDPLGHNPVTQTSCMSDMSSDDFSNDLERRLTADVLGLELLDTDLYRGTHLWKPPFARAVFGGQIVGQCLVAAGKTVPHALNLHSMHSYFIRPGDPDNPVIYRVSRTRDGTSFTSRTVTAIQRGVPILTLQASFHNEPNEPTCHVEYRPQMPEYKHHSELKTPIQLAETFSGEPHSKAKIFGAIKHLTPELPIEIKPINPEVFLRLKKNDDNKLVFWVKACGQLGKSSLLLFS